ncbi:hypothetical protein QLX41_gp037 [Listeria phage LMTA-94]|uniref:Uncharacterized protein n=2 Tax=Pecentumvirus LMSP25 TaxID=2560554 RepID=A0A068CB24_9CAUD|nr:hypothetical protein QLX42_gp066 [Listeria phage LMTA-57]YP_009793536.1 hypothetical protein QLX41_gp037 [Listeria phage LMTA-94]AID17125.1 hypothetical protein [Listeria phage LMTA-94]AID17520.1 hypothetical protein [Listeria phage LMTA-57]
MSEYEASRTDLSRELLQGDLQPSIMRRGILYIRKKPEYIVEYVEEASSDTLMVSVFAVQPKSKPPLKAWTLVDKTFQYNTGTTLGLLAKELKHVPKKTEKRENPPLFIAPALDGVDTFTGRAGKGFYDREPDRATSDGKIVQGKHTGVFVGFDSITWEKAIVLTEEIASRYLTARAQWYNI